MLKKLFLMAVIVFSALLIQTTAFASDIIFRNDDLEGHNLGSVAPTLSVPTFGGVVTADKKGGLQVTGTNVTGEIVSMKDKNNNDTKALKISRTSTGGSIFQFLSDTGTTANQSYVTNDTYIYKLSLKGDSTNNMNYIDIGKARLYIATGRLDTVADTNADPDVVSKTYNSSFNSTNDWFDFTYVVDKPSDTVRIYINDELKATQTYGGIFNNATSISNTLPRIFTNATTAGAILYVDNVLAYSINSLDYTTNLTDTNVALDKEIQITFNSPVNQATINTITVSNANGAVATQSIVLNDRVCTIKLLEEMDLNTSYTIDLSQVKNIYDLSILDPKKTITFSTISQIVPITVNSPTFYKINLLNSPVETPISTLQAGLISGAIKVQNNLQETKTVTIISVLRKNNVYEAIAYQEDTIPADSFKVLKCGFNILNTNDYSIDLFVWDSILGFEQLGDKYTFDKNGTTIN